MPYKDPVKQKACNDAYKLKAKEKIAAQKKEYYKANKELMNEKNRLHYEANKDTILTKHKEYRENNPDKVKESTSKSLKKYYINNKETILIKTKEYRDTNQDVIKAKAKIYRDTNRDKLNTYMRERRKNDKLFGLACNMRTLINSSIKRKGYTKKSRTFEILGCTFEQFKEHLEGQFEPWMSWENKGLYNGTADYGWDVDHIIPVDSAINEDDVIRLNHYTNLRPLCSYINRDVKRNLLDYFE